jgi:hypothetical protein
MRHLITAVILTSLAATPLQAASDSGLTLHNQTSASVSRGMGVQASLTLKFGDRRTVRASEKLALGIAAGPVISVTDSRGSGGTRRSGASVASFALKPGYSATLSLAGQPLIKSYTKLGAADEQRSDGEKKQGTGDKAAWVAAVAGGVMVALLGVGYLVLHEGCPTCGS